MFVCFCKLEITEQTNSADVAGSQDVENEFDGAFYDNVHTYFFFLLGINVINGRHPLICTEMLFIYIANCMWLLFSVP